MEPVGVYIHIPFCDSKCYYCGFFSRKQNQRAVDEYTEKLIDIIKDRGERIGRRVRSVYFGGGTPSVIGHDRLIAILDAVRSSFSVDDNAEITVEVNPTSADELDFRKLREAGFSRLSIGMQSANDNELRLLGRRHSRDDVEITVKRARAAGFDNISLDVMLAIPSQTTESLDRTLSFCSELNVEHISAYILKIEEGTRFYRDREKLSLFTDDEQAAFYEQTVDKLSELGYDQYEISNFSETGRESRHNLLYWHDEEYIGFGPSAHSFIDGERYYYPDSFEAFYADQTEHEGTGGDNEEYIMLALRLSEGVSFERYRKRFGEDIPPKFITAAKKLEYEGLVVLSENSVSLTVKGFLVSNSVIAYLTGYL